MEQPIEEHDGPCRDNGGSEDKICSKCIERMRAAGIPEHTIKWMQQSKLDRINSVMF